MPLIITYRKYCRILIPIKWRKKKEKYVDEVNKRKHKKEFQDFLLSVCILSSRGDSFDSYKSYSTSCRNSKNF